jgi:hypothetical protein
MKVVTGVATAVSYSTEAWGEYGQNEVHVVTCLVDGTWHVHMKAMHRPLINDGDLVAPAIAGSVDGDGRPDASDRSSSIAGGTMSGTETPPHWREFEAIRHKGLAAGVRASAGDVPNPPLGRHPQNSTVSPGLIASTLVLLVPSALM